MNAAITTHTPHDLVVPNDSIESAGDFVGSSGPRSFGSFQAQSITVCVLGVFLATALIHYGMQGGLAQALGLATYLGVWIGGGFGFLVGGVRWGLEHVAFDQGH